MSALRNYLNKIKPNFEEGGKLHAFRSVFDGFETFLEGWWREYSRCHRLEAHYEYGGNRPDARHAVWYV